MGKKSRYLKNFQFSLEGISSDSVAQHEPPQQQTIQIIEQHLTTPHAEGNGTYCKKVYLTHYFLR